MPAPASSASASGHGLAVRDLFAGYRGIPVVRELTLQVRPGEVVALLGPNGAGKTTIVRILATLLKADAGRALVSGYDVVSQAVQVRQLIALTGQYASVDDELTGTENLVMIGRLLGFSRATARSRAAELLERFDLTGAAGRAAIS